MLELHQICKTFNLGTINEKMALNHLTFTLKAGDFATVIGGNGAGKSTMLNAIAGVWPVDEGSIRIDGEDITELSEYARAGMRARQIPIIEAQTPIIPIYTYEPYRTLAISREIYDAGVYVNPVLPPACNPGECLLRTSYLATLTEPLIDEALDLIGQVMEAHRHD